MSKRGLFDSYMLVTLVPEGIPLHQHLGIPDQFPQVPMNSMSFCSILPLSIGSYWIIMIIFRRLWWLQWRNAAPWLWNTLKLLDFREKFLLAIFHMVCRKHLEIRPWIFWINQLSWEFPTHVGLFWVNRSGRIKQWYVEQKMISAD